MKMPQQRTKVIVVVVTVLATIAVTRSLATAAQTFRAELDEPPFPATESRGDGENRTAEDRMPAAAEGLFKGGADLVGSGALIYALDGNLSPEAATVSFWLKPGFNPNESAILWRWDSRGDTRVQLWKGTAERLYFDWHGHKKQTVTFTFSDDFDYDDWHHIAIAWDRSGEKHQMWIWVDGEPGAVKRDLQLETDRMYDTFRLLQGGVVDRLRIENRRLHTPQLREMVRERPGGGSAEATEEADQPPLLSEDLFGEEAAARMDQLQKRHDRRTILPRTELQPGFTRDARQTFTLDTAAMGRKRVEIEAVTLNGEELPPDSWRFRGTELRIEPDRDLERGLNTFELAYGHPDPPGEPEKVVRFQFRVNHNPDPTHVRYGRAGELIVNGERRFAIGGYRSGQTDDHIDALPTAAEAGLTWVHDYANAREREFRSMGFEAKLQRTREYVRRAEELGLGVMMGIPREAVQRADEPFIARWVSALSQEPAVWFWYLYDEPTPGKVTPESVARVKKLVNRLDPLRPTVVTVHREDSLVTFHPLADALWVDRYPVSATGREGVSLTPVYAEIRRAREVVGAAKPMSAVLQLHDNRGLPWLREKLPNLAMPSDEDHRPNQAEVRAMAHAAFAAGVRSLSYYWAPESWYSLKEDAPGHWENFEEVVRELKELEPIVLAFEPDERVFIEQPAGGKVLHWARRYDGDVYVGVVNTNVQRSVEVALPTESNGADEWTVHAAYADSELTEPNRLHLGPAGVIVVKRSGS